MTMQDSPATLVEVSHLVKNFRVTRGVMQRTIGMVQAVSDVSFTVGTGETFGIVGESGCGKTTIGRLLVGLDRPTSGTIRIAGKRLDELHGKERRKARRDVQLMFQDPYSSLNPRMRIGTIIREPLDIQKIGTRKERREHVASLLSEVGLSAKMADRYPHELSGGQRQRIGLARALALRPRLIVADEPVSALDVSIRSQILNLMNDLQSRHGLTYVVISHDLSVTKYISDRIAVIYLGKLVELCDSNDLYEEPAHPYTSGLIQAIPIPDPGIERNKSGDVPKGELPSALDPPSGCRYRTRCPLAQEICAQAEPPLRPIRAGHLVACHFPLLKEVADAAGQTEPLPTG